MEHNSTLIPVKIRVVRELAKITLKEQESLIHRDLADKGRLHIAFLEDSNKSFLRRTGLLKKVEIPTLEQVVQGWKAEWKKNQLDIFHPASMILDRVVSKWWQRLQLFSKLSELKDDEVMYISTADAELINLTANWDKV
jgi:hypothetical protein